LHVSVSIGIALHSEGAVGVDAIMSQADLALYRAKADGRDGFQFHSEALDQQVHLRVSLAEELRTALKSDELELYYQPQVEMRSGRIVGLEALVRWNHPTRGLIRPTLFIPVAEQTGVIRALGQWVLTRACRQVRDWEEAGVAVPRLAVNVSGAQLRQPREFELCAAAILAETGVHGEQIELEITESVLMDSTERDAETLERLRDLGMTIAIDDFGTGYSSLTYLANYPVTKLKIAQDLIAGVPSDPRKGVVVRSAVHLAIALGIECIAEGVETADQVRFMLEAGCEIAQGYYYSVPVPAAGIPDLVSSRALFAEVDRTAAG
jgi:EAL domain-containing protein (putative c-di-GMP-specific phosphodiesterase class I)